jgi:hypothetical protein
MKRIRCRHEAISRKDARKRFDKEARKHFKCKDGQEWLVRYIYGEFREDIPVNISMILMIPFAR